MLMGNFYTNWYTYFLGMSWDDQHASKVDVLLSWQVRIIAHCLNQNVTFRKGLPPVECYRKSGGMSRMAKQELLATIRDRYRASSRKDKSRGLRIYDEAVQEAVILVRKHRIASAGSV